MIKVAAANSSATDKARADIVCAGVGTDQVGINAALDGLNAYQLGTVELAAGDYTTNGSITRTNDIDRNGLSLTLRGEGVGTRINPTQGYAAGVPVYFHSWGAGARMAHVTLDNMHIVQTGVNGPNGAVLFDHCNNATIPRLWVNPNCPDFGYPAIEIRRSLSINIGELYFWLSALSEGGSTAGTGLKLISGGSPMVPCNRAHMSRLEFQGGMYPIWHQWQTVTDYQFSAVIEEVMLEGAACGDGFTQGGAGITWDHAEGFYIKALHTEMASAPTTATVVAQDAPLGQNWINVASTAGFVVGQRIKVGSDYTRVVAVAAPILSLEASSPHAYPAGTGVAVKQAILALDHIRKGRITCASMLGDGNPSEALFTNCYGVKFDAATIRANVLFDANCDACGSEELDYTGGGTYSNLGTRAIARNVDVG